MTNYYLMVNEVSNLGKTNFSLVRRIEGSHKTAKIEQEKYERELNNGLTYNEVCHKVVIRELPTSVLQTFKSVCAIPYGEARNYTSFWTWKCNKELVNQE